MTGFVYFIKAENGPIKIGWSAEPTTRLRNLRCATVASLHMEAVVPSSREHERYTHNCLAEHCVGGEWFNDHADVRAFMEKVCDGDWGGFVPTEKKAPDPSQVIAQQCADFITRCATLAELEISAVDQSILWKFAYRPTDPMISEYNALLKGVLVAVDAAKQELDRMAEFARKQIADDESQLRSIRESEDQIKALSAELASLITGPDAPVARKAETFVGEE